MSARLGSLIQESETDLGSIAKMVMKLFDLWRLPNEAQLALLGLAQNNRAALGRYKRGENIGTTRDQFERVGHLLAIHKNLRLLFPSNPEFVYSWMSTRNKAFGQTTPVEVIQKYGFAGLLMVRAYLDRARGV